MMDDSRPLRGILETSLYVRDLHRAKAFFGEVIGLEVVLEAEGRHVFFRCGTGMLLVFDPDAASRPSDSPLAAPAHGAHGPGHVAFAVDDDEGLRYWRDRLRAAGHPIEAEIEWPNGARSIYVRDPAGNSIEFATTSLWRSGSPQRI